jgi:hypothetical protein
MLGSGAMVDCDMPADLMQKVQGVCASFEKAVAHEVRSRNLPRAMFSALLPCNLLCLVDAKLLHIAFTHINAGGLPRQIWQDWRSKNPLTSLQVGQSAVSELGFVNPTVLYFDAVVLGAPDSVREEATERAARQHVEGVFKAATRPQTIPGYEGLQPLLDRFSDDHPDFSKNVFIAMRFRPGKQFLEIHEAVKSGLAKYGLKGLRSDDKTYPPDGDLWTNICVYMMGCRLGVCVFEEIDEREFNPNVPLEYGFMRATNRQVLLLKDIRMPKMPSDMTGKLYRNFDTYNITLTVHEQTSQWAERDLGLKVI